MELKFFEIKYSKHEVKIPYYEIIGKSTGPMGFISAGIHGNDLNSINVLRNFIRVAKTTEIQKKLKGVLIIFPILNISGFENNTRNVFEDGKDLNLQFGKRTFNNLSSAIAFELSHNFFKKCDFGINFYDCNSTLTCISHPSIVAINELDFAKNFGSKVIMQKRKNKNLMPNILQKEFGTRILNIEAGSRSDEITKSVKPLMQGIRNILITEKMLDSKSKILSKHIILNTKSGMRAKESGILDLKIELSEKVSKGQRLGTIFYPQTQKTEILFAEKAGFIFAKRISKFIKRGKTVFTIL